jgi:hypothetical protein
MGISGVFGAPIRAITTSMSAEFAGHQALDPARRDDLAKILTAFSICAIACEGGELAVNFFHAIIWGRGE